MRLLRVILGLMAALLLLAASASSADGWRETFDNQPGYPATALPSPWEGNANVRVLADLGYNGTSAFQWPTQGWDWAYACRPIEVPPRVGDALVARVYLPAESNWRQVRFGLTANRTPSPSGGFADGAKVDIYISTSTRTDPEGRFSYWSFWTSDSNDKRTGVETGAPSEQWYDVRLTLAEHRKVTAEFRNVKMDYWVPIGALATPGDFVPRYVSIASSRGGIMDDVGYVPAAEDRGSAW